MSACPACGEKHSGQEAKCRGCGSPVPIADAPRAVAFQLAPSAPGRSGGLRKALSAGLIAGPPIVIVIVAIVVTHMKAQRVTSRASSNVLVGGEEEFAGASQEGRPVRIRFLSLLWKEYGENEAVADARYRGKTIEFKFSGKLQPDGDGWALVAPMFEPTALSPEQLAHQSQKERKWFSDGYPPNVICRIAPDQIEAFADRMPNSPCTIRGVCEGKRDADVGGGYVVTFSDCKLVK
jgi:hypothetical protein